MAEEYVESIIMRKDCQECHTGDPMFVDDDCDITFEFEGKIKLTSINKVVQNATHNKHDYVFQIVSIDKIQKEE